MSKHLQDFFSVEMLAVTGITVEEYKKKLNGAVQSAILQGLIHSGFEFGMVSLYHKIPLSYGFLAIILAIYCNCDEESVIFFFLF